MHFSTIYKNSTRLHTHCISTLIGFSADIDNCLLNAADITNHSLNRYVTLVMDEVHIKEDLVYDKHQGHLIGFVNLGNTNNKLLEFEATMNGDTDRPLANSMLVFMVRGLFNNLAFPYVQFSCSNWTGDLLVDPVWEAVSRLERMGFQVMALTCDGASTVLAAPQ